jgi:acyl-CoA synthetase (NDP forming)
MRVAIIGASGTRSKYGNKALRSYAAAGHEVYAVNPNEHEVEGHQAYASAKDIPGQVDRALLYVPPSVGINVLEDLAQAGIREVYVNPGAGSPELLARGNELGLDMIEDCAIIAIGDSPARY